jgi:hypothetical protein
LGIVTETQQLQQGVDEILDQRKKRLYETLDGVSNVSHGANSYVEGYRSTISLFFRPPPNNTGGA